ncbi:hypothetical protein [Streptosporangium sp. KLBMP 9127]|nr:hypothetical protein [Streptosporangium sp. KLBMP 9127]
MREPDSSYVRKKSCTATCAAELCIGDETWLTHHTFDHFLNEPRYRVEREVSLLTGRLSVEEASRYRRALITVSDLEGASVRYTTAGNLRVAGLAVVHTPGRVTKGCAAEMEHVSVIWPAADPVVRQDIPWPPEVTQSFLRCFNGYEQAGVTR